MSQPLKEKNMGNQQHINQPLKDKNVGIPQRSQSRIK
jgi:hypothetical protein